MAIQFKRSSTTNDPPTTSDITSIGEIAINVEDGKMWSSNGTAIIPLGTHANIQTFSASGTWVKPRVGNQVLVMLWAGGGSGGGGVNTASNTGGGGGGGGGFSWRIIPLSDISGNVSVTIGAGGAGTPVWPSSTTMGKNGGNSSFGSYLTVQGGCGGWGSNASQASNGGHGGTPGFGGPLSNGYASSVNTFNYYYNIRSSSRYALGHGGNSTVGIAGFSGSHGFGGGGGGVQTSTTGDGGNGAPGFGGGSGGGGGGPRDVASIPGGNTNLRIWPWGVLGGNGGGGGNSSIPGFSGSFPGGGGGGVYGGDSGSGNNGQCFVYTW
jgi:hypothetical protein